MSTSESVGTISALDPYLIGLPPSIQRPSAHRTYIGGALQKICL
jgi:hypothetical protein